MPLSYALINTVLVREKKRRASDRPVTRRVDHQSPHARRSRSISGASTWSASAASTWSRRPVLSAAFCASIQPSCEAASGAIGPFMSGLSLRSPRRLWCACLLLLPLRGLWTYGGALGRLYLWWLGSR